MPSAEWQTHNAFISGHEIIRNVDWITKASRDVKPVYTSVKKYSDEVIANMPAARIKIQQHHTATQLWYNWEMLLNRSEFQQIPIIGRLLAERLRKQKPELVGLDFLAEVEKKVQSTFKKEVRPSARPSPVDVSTPSRGSTSKKSYADLPAEAKQACDKFVKQGLLSKDQYVKDYFGE